MRKHRGGQIHQLPRTKQELITFANAKRDNINESINYFKEIGWTSVPDFTKIMRGIEQQDASKVQIFLRNWNKIADIIISTQRGGRRRKQGRKRKGGEGGGERKITPSIEQWSDCWKTCILAATGGSAVIIAGIGWYAGAGTAVTSAASSAYGGAAALLSAAAAGDFAAFGGMIWAGLSKLATPMVAASVISKPAILSSVYTQVGLICKCAQKARCREWIKNCKTRKAKRDFIFKLAKQVHITLFNSSGMLESTRGGVLIDYLLDKEFGKEEEKREAWEADYPHLGDREEERSRRKKVKEAAAKQERDAERFATTLSGKEFMIV